MILEFVSVNFIVYNFLFELKNHDAVENRVAGYFLNVLDFVAEDFTPYNPSLVFGVFYKSYIVLEFVAE